MKELLIAIITLNENKERLASAMSLKKDLEVGINNGGGELLKLGSSYIMPQRQQVQALATIKIGY